ncbi:trans-2,3-dihydro-3-hydroxyanthranilate isomerase [Pedobacter sp. W3I1]|uniref:PhzF family phenazine biosynthesis protein n=1 Tax=Pedobacter sp. W3I1 TaxID=3042291 RepID=UPI00278163C2|nr:PhzF family phenazine biosynthesis protein [Pedobacter sp. W3I1]MDQ0639722.1 trans-2,3-dihydro-3-hydroxyanthranilate isomerase [Pedobacter sp. W3I1]
MKKIDYYVLDVFTDQKFKGNQLSVVCTDGELKLEQYYDIAREFGYSETSFINFSAGTKALNVRSFTPARFEITGAGHNLLGAVCLALLKKWDIFSEQKGNTWVLMAGEQIPVQIAEKDGFPYVGMRQRPAQIGGTTPTEVIAEAVGLDIADLSLNGWAIQTVKTEVGHLMVPVKNLEALEKAVLNKKLLKQASTRFGFEGCYLFTTDHPDQRYLAEARFFNPSIGIDEDPATGTAAGPLTGYLETLGFIERHKDYSILQGKFVNQPSTIQVRVVDEGIWVSGSSVIVMEGGLYLSE